MAIRIITDSASDLSRSAAEAMGISIVPLTVQFGDTTYLDGQTIDSATFYDLLKTSTETPTTSQPTPDAFLQHFQQAKDAGDHVVAILLSGALSGTLQSAKIAKDLCEYDPIYIVDSRSATSGVQLLLHHACALRDAGKDAAEIAAEVDALKDRIRIFAVIDTLEYLRRGGRLSNLAANIGTVTKLKPTITVRDGAVDVIGKSFGSAAALKHLLKLVGEHPVDKDHPVFFIYTDDPNSNEKLLPKLCELGIPTDPPTYAGVGPAIGTHVGPGAFGLIYIEKN